MAQTDAQLTAGARELSRQIFVVPNISAHCNHAELKSALQSIDQTMDLLPAGLTSNRTVKQNLLDRLAEPFKTRSTAGQKAYALQVWSMVETGIIA